MGGVGRVVVGMAGGGGVAGPAVGWGQGSGVVPLSGIAGSSGLGGRVVRGYLVGEE